jgi:hypothetical protein
MVATAARRVADSASEGLAAPWPMLVRQTVAAADDAVAERLDRAVGGADMHATAPRWWRAAGALQRLLALAVAVGLVWLLALGVLGYLLVDDLVPVPEVRDVPIPTWLVVGGAAAGIVLALLARLVNGAAAERRSRAAARSLHARVADVGQELVIAPVEVELDAHARFCTAIAVAAGGRQAGGEPSVGLVRKLT